MSEPTLKEIKLRATIVVKSITGITLDRALHMIRSFEMKDKELELIVANCHLVYEIPED